jgi:hypothetical protein
MVSETTTVLTCTQHFHIPFPLMILYTMPVPINIIEQTLHAEVYRMEWSTQEKYY